MTPTPAAEAYPLYWPDGWQRTRWRKPAAFRVGKGDFARIRDRVMANLARMGGRHVVLSSNVSLRLDGLPYAGQREPEDPGVAVYWWDAKAKQQRAIACDRWNRVVHNLRAIELSLEALRGLDRWGSTEIVERAFTGFTALPPAGDDWRSVLKLGPGATLEQVRDRYREAAREAHPDLGGNPHEMQRINAAWEAAQRELGG